MKWLGAVNNNGSEDSQVHVICGKEHTLPLPHLMWYDVVYKHNLSKKVSF